MTHFKGHYYHVFNRGVNRQPIFKNTWNYFFLLRRIKQFLPSYQIIVVAYCLMPNHYHFLFYVKEDGALAPFLQRLFNSYTQAFNRQQGRTGTLFEGRPKSRMIDESDYLFHIARYIHLNPVRAGLVARPEEWPYSNYQEFIGKRSGTLFDFEFVKEQFNSPFEYQEFVEAEIPTEVEKRLGKYYLD